MFYEFQLNYNAVEATKTVLQYSNQIVQEISLCLQEPQQRGKVR